MTASARWHRLSAASKDRDMNSYAFSAIRGVQAGRAYYVIMVPLKSVGTLFRFDDEELPPALRAQREINKGRIPAISKYITDHPKDYVLSALAASIDGGFRFEPVGGDGHARSVGTLIVDMTATILINDGQHRRAGIVEALRQRPHLGDESIAVTLFPDQGLERSQQMFVDLNQHGVKPARSLRLLYDHRDDRAQLTRAVADAVPLFRDMTDFTRSNLPAGSRKLFAFSNLHTAVTTLVDEAGIEADAMNPEPIADFWSTVVESMPDWRLAGAGEIAASELRKDKIHAHGIALEAIAIAGARVIGGDAQGWRKAIRRLGDIDWSRANTELWEGRALLGGKIHRSRTSVVLTADAIYRSIGSEAH